MSHPTVTQAGIHRLPQAAWPAAIILAWHAAANSRRGRSRSADTYKSYAASVAVYLWYLRAEGLLDADASLADLVSPDRMDDYFEWLLRHGNAPYSILSRFRDLHAALRMMHPAGDFGFVTKPDGMPLQQTMEMRRRILFVPDARHNVFWAEALFRDALALPAAIHRQVQVRDAAMIGIFAELAPRARAMQGLRLRHLLRNGEEWILRQEGSIMKGQRTVLELPLSPRVGAILDRYLAVERRELLRGQDHDALWVTINGTPLRRPSVEQMIRIRSKAHYGIAFGPHRFRTSLTTTVALVGGDRPFDASLILGHDPATSLKNYNRARAIEASRAHDERISALEDDDDPPWGGSADEPKAIIQPELGHASSLETRRPETAPDRGPTVTQAAIEQEPPSSGRV
jgi:integrase